MCSLRLCNDDKTYSTQWARLNPIKSGVFHSEAPLVIWVSAASSAERNGGEMINLAVESWQPLSAVIRADGTSLSAQNNRRRRAHLGSQSEFVFPFSCMVTSDQPVVLTVTFAGYCISMKAENA